MPGNEIKTKSDIVIIGLAITLTGWLFAPGLGFILIFIGIGAILGIPIIIVGLIIGLIGFISLIVAVFSKTIKVLCPYCETQNKVLSDTKTFECHECKQRVLIKNNTAEKIN